jgi:hypothetical protein
MIKLIDSCSDLIQRMKYEVERLIHDSERNYVTNSISSGLLAPSPKEGQRGCV